MLLLLLLLGIDHAVPRKRDRLAQNLDIADVVGEVLDLYDPAAPSSIDEVLEIDREARRVAAAVTGKIRN